MSPVLIGPAGWSYPHWEGVAYPRPKPRGFHPLTFLSEFFPVIEINSSFHQPLKPEITWLWTRMVEGNPGFRFTAKAFRMFTHERQLDRAVVAEFAAGLWPLQKAGRLGALLLQFPWSFRFTAENREYFIQLRRALHEFPLVAEMRHSSWLSDEGLGTFLDYRVGFANIDQPEHLRATPPSAVLTSGVGYVRLHGRNGNAVQEIPEQSRDYLYSAPELASWKTRIERLQRNANQVFVVFNNDAGARSLVNALQLQGAMGVSRGVAPKDLLRRYPVELQGWKSDRPYQAPLFFEPPRLQPVTSGRGARAA